MAREEPRISSSDMEKYGYCPLSWWLGRQDATEDNAKLELGTQKHKAIGKNLKKIQRSERRARQSESSSLVLALISVILAVNGAVVIYAIYAPTADLELVSGFLAGVAILWVLVASIFFSIGYYRYLVETSSDVPTLGRARPKPRIRKSVTLSGEIRFMVLLFLAAALILAYNGLVILLLPKTQFMSSIMVALALIWLFGTGLALYLSLRRHRDLGIQHTQGKLSASEQVLVVFAVVASLLALSGISIERDPSADLGQILMILAIVWMYGSFFFLYREFKAGKLVQSFGKLLLIKLMKAIMEDGALDEDLVRMRDQHIRNAEKGTIWFSGVAVVLAVNVLLIRHAQLARVGADDIMPIVFEVVSLVWLIGASYFLYTALKNLSVASKLKSAQAISGSIAYADQDTSEHDSKLLVSKEYPLRGRPDLIVEKDGALIPYEIKTGRTPRGPLFSHILQLGSYLLLIEESSGNSPPYGVLRYPEKDFEIKFDPRLKDTVIQKLEEMKTAIASTDVHRNHNRPNKCFNCSRKTDCPEKLT